MLAGNLDEQDGAVFPVGEGEDLDPVDRLAPGRHLDRGLAVLVLEPRLAEQREADL